jgi:UDP-2,4-diacetamido-2,4,6-trideoxy-beta-L-altropyranose hydrolase
MKIFVRADASEKIGAGHVMRCLTLAHPLSQMGFDVVFICRDFPGNLCELITTKGYRAFRLPWAKPSKHELVPWEKDADETSDILRNEGGIEWLIVDHYDLDIRWERQIRQFANKIMVIDDLANRPHDCDLLLDQNLRDNLEGRYENLLPKNCRKLLGPRYALLRPEFDRYRKSNMERDGRVRRILIFFGGSDPTNETSKSLWAIRSLKMPEIALDVVAGASNPHREEIRSMCSAMPNTTYHCQVENMAELMAAADLAIGAGGTATWERCCLGLPSLSIVLAENQLESTAAVAAKGAAQFLGWNWDVSSVDLAAAVQAAISDPARLKRMSKAASDIMGGMDYAYGNRAVLRFFGEISC